MSCIIGEKLGLKCPMFDINCACPGFVYALDMAETYYKAGKIRNAIAGVRRGADQNGQLERQRKMCPVRRRGRSRSADRRGQHQRHKPAWRAIQERHPAVQDTVDTPYITKKEEDVPMQMKGREVFKFAVKACTEGVQSLLDEVGIDKSEVAYFMIHQANQRIIDSIINYMGQPAEKFPVNITDHGNSSSAPALSFWTNVTGRGMFKKGDILVFSAFGAGLL